MWDSCRAPSPLLAAACHGVPRRLGCVPLQCCNMHVPFPFLIPFPPAAGIVTSPGSLFVLMRAMPPAPCPAPTHDRTTSRASATSTACAPSTGPSWRLRPWAGRCARSRTWTAWTWAPRPPPRCARAFLHGARAVSGAGLGWLARRRVAGPLSGCCGPWSLPAGSQTAQGPAGAMLCCGLSLGCSVVEPSF